MAADGARLLLLLPTTFMHGTSEQQLEASMSSLGRTGWTRGRRGRAAAAVCALRQRTRRTKAAELLAASSVLDIRSTT